MLFEKANVRRVWIFMTRSCKALNIKTNVVFSKFELFTRKLLRIVTINVLLTFLCYFKTIPNPTPARMGHASLYLTYIHIVLLYHIKVNKTLKRLWKTVRLLFLYSSLFRKNYNNILIMGVN